MHKLLIKGSNLSINSIKNICFYLFSFFFFNILYRWESEKGNNKRKKVKNKVLYIERKM